MLVSGVSGSGKSTFVSQIIKERNEIICPPPERVLYFAKYRTSVDRSIIDEVEFHSGLPTAEILENLSNLRTLIVIDDLQDSSFNSPEIVSAFQTGRHSNIALIITTQNLFPRSPKARDISLNCNLIVVFFNARDSSTILPLSRQISPLYPTTLSQIYFTHINSAYKYLLIDLSPTADDILRFRSSIFSPATEIFVRDRQLKDLKDEASQAKYAFDYELQEAE
jgi:nucleoside-triphosphatase THEP1